jgi:hypothetical protein
MNIINSPSALVASLCGNTPGGLKVVQSGPHAGRVYVTWTGSDVVTNAALGCDTTALDTQYSVWIAWSDDQGKTWTDQVVRAGAFGQDAAEIFSDLALDNRGNPYVAFSDNLAPIPRDGGPDDQWDIYVMASFDGGKSWNGKADGTGDPTRVTTDAGTHIFPAIAVGDPGKVDVAYLGTTTKVAELPYGKQAPGGGTTPIGSENAGWRVYMAQTLNLRASKPVWRAQQITDEPMHVGDICTLGLSCLAFEPLGADRNLLDFIDVAVDAQGLAHIIYTDDNKNPGIQAANQVAGDRVIAPSVLARRFKR